MARPQITEKLFWAIKTLYAGGASTKEASEYFGVSEATLRLVNKSESLEEYRNMQCAIHAKYRKLAPSKPVQPAPEKPANKVDMPYMPYSVQREITEQLKAQTELLKLISAKLVYIVEQLS